MNSETQSTCPLEADPPVVRILLSKAASAALSAAGADAFAVICRAMRTDAGEEGRWALHLAPVAMRTAQDACKVLSGELVASKPRKRTKPVPDAIDDPPAAT